MDKMNPDNSCAKLYKPHYTAATEADDVDLLRSIFKLQLEFQLEYSSEWSELMRVPNWGVKKERRIGLAIIEKNWIRLCVEFGELMNKLPYKPWKKYPSRMSTDETLEMQFEMIDMLHFFVNMMMGAGITAERAYNLYVSKNRENVRRQKNGY